MNSELFNRIKKLVKNEGRVIVLDENGKDSFVIMPLEEYEDSMGGECECGSCDCEDDAIEEVMVNNDPFLEDINDASFEADKELLKKVNEDIAKWRAEQSQKEEIKEEMPAITVAKEEKPANLEEEDRYYLEPLE